MKSCVSFSLKLSPRVNDRDDAMPPVRSDEPAFVPPLVIPAPERIHAEGDLGRWIETAAIPCDQHTPEAPNLTGGEPKGVKGRAGYPASEKQAVADATVPRALQNQRSNTCREGGLKLDHVRVGFPRGKICVGSAADST